MHRRDKMAHASVARRWDLNNDRAGTAELEKKKKK
jgi:hypothetical protein